MCHRFWKMWKKLSHYRKLANYIHVIQSHYSVIVLLIS